MANAKRLPSGNWRVQVFIGRDENGKKLMKSFTAATRGEAQRAASVFIAEMNPDRRHLTVRQAITGYITLKRNVLAPSTIHGYEIIRDHRLQSLMDVDIHDVDSFALQRAINEDAAVLSRKSLQEAKSLLLSAMKLYGVQPVLSVTLPAKKPHVKNLPTAEQIIDMLRGTDIELPCLLAMWMSLRISEVRGLQFGDLHGDVLTVQRSKVYVAGKDIVRDVNKTVNSTRRLALPKYLLDLINAVPHESATDFIVPIGYQCIKHRFRKLTSERGFEMTFHDLRHLNASIMLMLGIPDKYAMERGGWSTPHTLKSVYQHTFSDERKHVDQTIDSYFNDLLGV